MMSLRRLASWAKMMSLRGKLTALACHLTKFVNKAEQWAFLSINIGTCSAQGANASTVVTLATGSGSDVDSIEKSNNVIELLVSLVQSVVECIFSQITHRKQHYVPSFCCIPMLRKWGKLRISLHVRYDYFQIWFFNTHLNR